MINSTRPLAVITGASSGIGYELAKCCARAGYELFVVSDEVEISRAALDFEKIGVKVESLQADLATAAGVDRLYEALEGRPVAALLANAGRGLGRGFLDQHFEDWKRVVDTNITGTLYLTQKIANDMRKRGSGKILITGSIAGFMPGTYQAVYNGSKAFLDSFSFALRHELKNTGITVTCLMPGATETEFFERADMLDTKVGQDKKADPQKVAEDGFQAMQDGKGEVISGWANKMRAAIASIVPADLMADAHEKMAAPGTGQKKSA